MLEQTDAIIVGESDDVTKQNTLDAIQIIHRQCPEKPVFQELTSPDYVSSSTIAAVDWILLPTVFNGDRAYIIEKQLDIFAGILEKLIVDFNLNANPPDLVSISDKIVGEGMAIQNIGLHRIIR